jgi:hypothetical protein
MDVRVRLLDLPAMHPRLLWETIISAAAAVLGQLQAEPPFEVPLAIQDVPGCDTTELRLLLDPIDLAVDRVARIRRTYEPARLIELAAIAVAGIGLYHAGGHEIVDVALRGSGADYLVDAAQQQLEIAGRSRRGDFGVAWQQQWRRLHEAGVRSGYVCVAEFESPRARLGFAAWEGE